MPRQERVRSESGIYHIIIRGINKQLIFEEESDYRRFLSILRRVKSRTDIKLFAYCILGNHAHLLLKEGGESVSETMQRICVMYAVYFNEKYGRTGHLFQNRYVSGAVDDNNYFLSVLIYILQNPVKAGLCKTPNKYIWSSYRDMTKRNELIDLKELAELVNPDVVANGLRRPCSIEVDEFDTRKRMRYSDAEATRLLQSTTDIANITDFQSRPRDAQILAVILLRNARIPLRQLSRITGVSKGVIEWWINKDKSKT
ncbi:hypothetical protein AGMMS49983_01720 [Clostridia bacterium]|nr:hypothetical protein AGMMS49983_01720 [Clostridia bacterium]